MCDMRVLGAVMLAAAVLVAGCSSPQGPDHAHGLVVAAPPSGYVGNSSASGPITSAAAAAPLMPVGLTVASNRLTADHFTGGYVQVFTKGSRFMTIVALDFAAAAEARDFQSFVFQQLSATGTVDIVGDPQIPGAQIYLVSAPTRSGTAPLFCDGVWFSEGGSDVDTVTCSPMPGYPDLAEQVAATEYTQAGGVLTAATPPI